MGPQMLEYALQPHDFIYCTRLMTPPGFKQPIKLRHHNPLLFISAHKLTISSLQTPLLPPSAALSQPSVIKNFAAMLEGKAIVEETDMLQKMQQDALHLAAKALDLFDVTECTDIAHFIKKDFDKTYGAGWQCIVGTDFGSFVTHYHGCFIYFGIGNLAVLLFRGVVNQADEANLFPALETVNA